jgi:hypothetical protein
MTPAEAQLMAEHAAYWTRFAERGTAVVFGPVLDPKGPWGLGVLAVADESEARSLAAGDPVIKANSGFAYEILPMPRAIVGNVGR